MKLAEALILRADLQKRIENLKQRLLRNAKVQEGDQPAESPDTLIAEMEKNSTELLSLIQRINRTNSVTSLEDGKTLSDALTVRDVLQLKHKIYHELAEAASVTQSRFTKSEVKYKPTVDIPQMQKHADQLAQTYRDLDTKIQEMNWLTDLLE